MEHVVALQMAGRWICGAGVGESRVERRTEWGLLKS